jgi:hypothetical protein
LKVEGLWAPGRVERREIYMLEYINANRRHTALATASAENWRDASMTTLVTFAPARVSSALTTLMTRPHPDRHSGRHTLSLVHWE